MIGVILSAVTLAFVNRTAELAELDAAGRKGGLLVIYGRRRVKVQGAVLQG